MITEHNSTETDLTITIAKEFDAEEARASRDQFEDIANNWQGNVIIDLNNVDFLDSSGIGAIVFLHKRLISRKCNLSLLGVGGQPQDVIKMLGVDRVIPITERESH